MIQMLVEIDLGNRKLDMWTEMGSKKAQGETHSPSERPTCLWLCNVSRSKALRDEARAVCTEVRLWRAQEVGHVGK